MLKELFIILVSLEPNFCEAYEYEPVAPDD